MRKPARRDIIGAFSSGGFIKAVRHLSALLVVVLCGVVHRDAGTSPWSDDRWVADQPAWYQLAAPYWHTALEGSGSAANGLTSVVDPLTSASRPGDVRAVAAVAAASAAGVMLFTLARAAVPFGFAAMTAIATTGSVLPVAAGLSVTHALMALAAAGLLLLSGNTTGRVSWRRQFVFSVLTIGGAAIHPAFVPFASGVWLVDLWRTRSASRSPLIVGGSSIFCALLVAAMMLRADLPTSATAGAPNLPTLAVALVTGRFPGDLQPAAVGSLTDTIARISAIQPMLWAIGAAVALVVTRASSLAATSALGAIFVVGFVSTTWVPDAGAALAPATISILVLLSQALAWTWHQPYAGARGLAIAGAIAMAAAGFIAPRGPLQTENAQMQAFVEAAAVAATGTHWTAGRLATTRALLQHRPHLAQERQPFDAGMLRDVDPGASMLALIDRTMTARPLEGLGFASGALRYQRADTFLAAQPPTTWLALAFRGNVGGEFCRRLLGRMDVRADASVTQGVAMARIRRDVRSVAAADVMDIPFGERLESFELNAPAHFQMDTRNGPRVAINGSTVAEASHGLVLGTFDAGHNQWRGLAFAGCDDTTLPEIEDDRLHAAYVVERHGDQRLPDVPAIASSPVQVPFDERGTPWFGPGWHGVEAEPMRWTSALQAEVYVISARVQSLRIRLEADVPAHTDGTRGLSIIWNGEKLPAQQAFPGDGAWVVPAALVRRGLNIMTLAVGRLVSPADSGSSDRRLLGAAVRHLSFVPIPAATTQEPVTARR